MNRWKIRALFVSAALLVAREGSSQSVEVAAQSEGREIAGENLVLEPLDQLIADLKAIMERRNVPGAGIAIVSKNEDIWVGALGIADVESNLMADENTLWRIGSISKMFVSLSALKLQEEGVLKLHDPLRDHVTDIPFVNPWSDTDPITLEHLLEHTSGFDDLHMNEYALQDPNITLRDALIFNPNSRESRWRPGTFSTYSNANPPIVAHVIAEKKGMPFEAFVEDTFFRPLGMLSSNYFITPEVEKRLAKGYQGNGAKQKAVGYWHIIMRPSGSINSSAKDMGKFVRFFLNRGVSESGRLLEEDSIQRMETVKTSYASRAGLELGYALNNYGKTFFGYKWQGHNGGMMGYLADLSYLPEHGVGFAVMINKSSSALNEMSRRISKYFTDQLPQVEAPEYVQLSDEELERFAGFYKVAAVRNQYQFLQIRLGVTTIEVKDGNLAVAGVGTRKRTLKPAGGSVFYVNNNKIASEVFFKNQEGQMCFGSMVRVPAWKVYLELTLLVLAGGTQLIALLFGVVAGFALLIRKLKKGKDWTTRLMPSYAVLCQVAAILILIPFLSDPFSALGEFSVPGLLSYLLNWGYPILIGIACWKTYKVFQEKATMHWGMKLYLVLACIGGVITNAYVLYWNPWLPSWMV